MEQKCCEGGGVVGGSSGGAEGAELRRVVDEKKRMEASLAEVRKEKAALEARVSQLELSVPHSAPSVTDTGYQLLHLFVAVVLALMGGLILGKLF